MNYPYKNRGYNYSQNEKPTLTQQDLNLLYKENKSAEDYTEYLKTIERVAKNLEISTSKLRKLFEIIGSIRDDLDKRKGDIGKELNKLVKFRIILEYMKNKDPKVKWYKPLKELEEEARKNPTKEKLKMFVDNFEALVAFSREKN